jgi:hypothetical protein
MLSGRLLLFIYVFSCASPAFRQPKTSTRSPRSQSVTPKPCRLHVLTLALLRVRSQSI